MIAKKKIEGHPAYEDSLVALSFEDANRRIKVGWLY
jgi:hypothetical protein